MRCTTWKKRNYSAWFWPQCLRQQPFCHAMVPVQRRKFQMLRQNRLPHSLSLTAYRAGLTNSIPKRDNQKNIFPNWTSSWTICRTVCRSFRISMMRSRTNWYRFRQIWKMQKQKKKSSTRRWSFVSSICMKIPPETDTWQCSFLPKAFQSWSAGQNTYRKFPISTAILCRSMRTR